MTLYCWVCGEDLVPKGGLLECPCCKETFPESLFYTKYCDACGRKATLSNQLIGHDDLLYTCALCNRMDKMVQEGQLDNTVAQSIVTDHHVQS